MTTLRRALPLALVTALLIAQVPLPAAAEPSDYDPRVTILVPSQNMTFGWVASLNVLVEDEAPVFDLELWVDGTFDSSWTGNPSELDGDGTVANLRFNATRLGVGNHELHVVMRQPLGAPAMSAPVQVRIVDAPLPLLELTRATYVGDVLEIEGYASSPLRTPLTLYAGTPFGWTHTDGVRGSFRLAVPLSDVVEGEFQGLLHATDGKGNNASLDFAFRIAPPTVLFDRVVDGGYVGAFAVPAGAVGRVYVCTPTALCSGVERIAGAVTVTVGDDACVTGTYLPFGGPCGFETERAEAGTVSAHTLLPVRVLVVAYV